MFKRFSKITFFALVATLSVGQPVQAMKRNSDAMQSKPLFYQVNQIGLRTNIARQNRLVTIQPVQTENLRTLLTQRATELKQIIQANPNTTGILLRVLCSLGGMAGYEWFETMASEVKLDITTGFATGILSRLLRVPNLPNYLGGFIAGHTILAATARTFNDIVEELARALPITDPEYLI